MNEQFVRTIWKPARFVLLVVLALSWLLLTQTVAQGAPPGPKGRAFPNGGFENGDFTGWTTSTYDNGGLAGAQPYTGASITRNPGGTWAGAAVGGPAVTPLSQPDPTLGSSASFRYPFDGHYSARVNNNTGSGHNGNRIQMQVTTTAQDVRTSDGKIHVFLAYAPVLDNPGHAANEQPYFYVALKNITKGTTLYEAFAFAGGGGLPWQSVGEFVYLNWQAIEVAPAASALAVGDVIELGAEAAGCTPSAHPGWVYLDDFGTLAPTTTTVSTAPNPSTYGQAVTFTANVTALAGGTVNTGTVQFYADGVAIGAPQNVTGGVATLSGITSLAVGNRTITAVYSGDADFAGSTSPNYTHVVNKATPTNVLTSSLNPSFVNQLVTFTATVGASGGTPTGTVTFQDGGVNIAGCVNVPLVGGVATCPTATLAAGTHPITAIYSGDGNYNGVTSNTVNQVVNKNPTTTVVTSSSNPCIRGMIVTTTAQVTGANGTPSGTVGFYSGTTLLTTVTLTNGRATFNMTCPGPTTYSITAQYNGDPAFLTSISGILSQVFMDPPEVPEADTLLLLGGGLGGLTTWLGWQWRRAKRAVK